MLFTPRLTLGVTLNVDPSEILMESYDLEVIKGYRRKVIITGSFYREVEIEGNFYREVEINGSFKRSISI